MAALALSWLLLRHKDSALPTILENNHPEEDANGLSQADWDSLREAKALVASALEALHKKATYRHLSFGQPRRIDPKITDI